MEAGVIHIMKAMARHAGAAQSLIEDDALQLLFHMVAMGVPTRNEGVSEVAGINSSSPLHLAQFHRHVMQVCSLLEVDSTYNIFFQCLGRSVLMILMSLLLCPIFSCSCPISSST